MIGNESGLHLLQLLFHIRLVTVLSGGLSLSHIGLTKATHLQGSHGSFFLVWLQKPIYVPCQYQKLDIFHLFRKVGVAPVSN
jgi:hypothetical protein